MDSYSVDVADRVSDIDPDEWDSVITAAGAPIFYSHAYLRAYERDPLSDVEGHAYLVVRPRGTGSSSARPVAVLPLYLQPRPDPLGCLGAAYPSLNGDPALLSHVWHCYDTHLPTALHPADPPPPPAEATDQADQAGPAEDTQDSQGAQGGWGEQATVAGLVSSVLDAMRRVSRRLGVAHCGLVNIARGSATSRALHAAGLPLRHIMDRFVVDLRGVATFQDYLARLPRPPRANLARNARRAAEAGVVTTVLPPEQANLDEVAALCERTAARFGNAGFYPAQTFSGFVTGLGEAAHVLEIRQHGRLVAAGVCLVDSQRFHTWTCGVDYDVDGNFSPYGVLFTEAVSLAIRLRLPVLEGGRSNAVFKQRHGLAVRHLDACLVPAS